MDLFEAGLATHCGVLGNVYGQMGFLGSFGEFGSCVLFCWFRCIMVFICVAGFASRRHGSRFLSKIFVVSFLGWFGVWQSIGN